MIESSNAFHVVILKQNVWCVHFKAKKLSDNKGHVFFHEQLLSVFQLRFVCVCVYSSLRHFEDLLFQIKNKLIIECGDNFSAFSLSILVLPAEEKHSKTCCSLWHLMRNRHLNNHEI